MTDYASSVRRAALEAARLHRDLGVQNRVVHGRGRVDVYEAIAKLNVSLFFTKLDGLLGVYLREPSPGVLVTTQRSSCIQRFTAAHELGHHHLGHTPSLDGEDILSRSPFEARPGDDPQEVEAEAFAAVFLLPRWLVDWHCEQQDWSDNDLRDPINVYQLSLRVGTSFKATVWTLHRYDVIDRPTAQGLSRLKLKDVKKSILPADYAPADFKRDVWLLTERDQASNIEGGPGDVFVMRLLEHSGSGYLWTIAEMDGDALSVVADGREALEKKGVGGPTMRRITAAARDARIAGDIRLEEKRPWTKASAPISTFNVAYDMAGPSIQGWYEPQRSAHLRAA